MSRSDNQTSAQELQIDQQEILAESLENPTPSTPPATATTRIPETGNQEPEAGTASGA